MVAENNECYNLIKAINNIEARGTNFTAGFLFKMKAVQVKSTLHLSVKFCDNLLLFIFNQYFRAGLTTYYYHRVRQLSHHPYL